MRSPKAPLRSRGLTLFGDAAVRGEIYRHTAALCALFEDGGRLGTFKAMPLDGQISRCSHAPSAQNDRFHTREIFPISGYRCNVGQIRTVL